MANVPVPGYQKFWKDKRATLREEQQSVAKYPDAEAQLKQLFKILCAIEVVAGQTPASGWGRKFEWTSIVNTAEDNRASCCKVLTGKALFSALYGTYTVTLTSLRPCSRRAP
jgi:hypothetical protein